MTEDTIYNCDIDQSIHEAAHSLYEIGAMDKKTMRKFDASCLKKPEQLSHTAILKLRKKENVSQSVFAYYLNVSKNLISDWERGIKKPSGPALRLLQLIEKHGIHILET